MIEFDELKKNWQNQKPAAGKEVDLKKITDQSLSKLKKFEKKQFRINMFKTTGIVLIFIYLIWAMLFASAFSPVKLAAVAWLVISAAVFLRIYWKTQLRVNKLNVRSSSLDFIDDVLDNFSEQKKLFRERFWLFGLALIVGINLLDIDILKDLQIWPRIGLHAAVTVILAATIWGGIKFRMFRFKREYEPIVKELTNIKQDLSETINS